MKTAVKAKDESSPFADGEVMPTSLKAPGEIRDEPVERVLASERRPSGSSSAMVRKTTLETIPKNVPSAAAFAKLGSGTCATKAVPSQIPPSDARIEMSFRIGPIGDVLPRTISVTNSMNAETSAGTGPKMKNASRIAISPKSNCR